MQTTIILAGVLAIAAGAAPAQSVGNYTCVGTDPNWALDLFDNQAQLRFAENTVDFEIPQVTLAEGGRGARALTLLGETDTAIVIQEEEICRIGATGHSHEVQVLTQRRGLPILLSGCCSVLQ